MLQEQKEKYSLQVLLLPIAPLKKLRLPIEHERPMSLDPRGRMHDGPGHGQLSRRMCLRLYPSLVHACCTNAVQKVSIRYDFSGLNQYLYSTMRYFGIGQPGQH